MSNRIVAGLACFTLMAMLTLALRAQDPADSFDHPAGNVNELTLAGLRPGRSTMAQAEALYGKHWRHPSRDEGDLYVWCDAHTKLRLTAEARPDGRIRVVTIAAMPPAVPVGACPATLPRRAARTGRGIRLGDSPRQLRSVYGKPFFTGPSIWNAHDVNMIVFNFSWAGASKPQILESSFAAGRLVKMTLSAEYY